MKLQLSWHHGCVQRGGSLWLARMIGRLKSDILMMWILVRKIGRLYNLPLFRTLNAKEFCKKYLIILFRQFLDSLKGEFWKLSGAHF
jgi:hypothetical protein